MRLFTTAMTTIAMAVLVGVFVRPAPAIADGNCTALSGTVAIEAIAFPNFPLEEPFASLSGTANVQIGGGQAFVLTVEGEVTDIVAPDEDDFDTPPSATVSLTFALDNIGSFEAVGEVVVVLPETTDLDGVFPVDAQLTITSGTNDFKGISGTIVSGGQQDFFAGVGTLELTGDICLRTVCHVPPGNPQNAHTIRVGAAAVPAHLDHGDYLGPCINGSGEPKGIQDENSARGNGTLACGVFSPALLLFCLAGMRLIHSRRMLTGTRL
jgi:hypothetical protein